MSKPTLTPTTEPSPAPISAVVTVVSLPPPPPFKDLFKQATDVLNEGFVRDFNVKLENLGDLTNNFTVDVTHTGSTGKESGLRGSLKQKADLNQFGFAHDLTFFSDNRFRYELASPVYSIAPFLAKLKVAHDFNAETYDAKLTPTLEVKNEKVNLSLSLDSPYSLAITKNSEGVQIREPPPYVPHQLTFQSSFRVIPFLFAGFSALVSSTGNWESVGLRTEWIANSNVVGFALDQENGVNKPLQKSFYLFSPFLSGTGKPNKIAFVATHGTSLSASLAVETALNDTTTFKTKLHNSGAWGLSLQQRLSGFAKVTASVVLSSGVPAYGLSFSLSDKYQ